MFRPKAAPAETAEEAGSGGRALHGKHLCVLLLLLTAAIFAGYEVRLPVTIQLGEEGDTPHVDGFYEPESNPFDVYRWSAKTAVVRFPGIGCPQGLTVRIRMNGARPEGVPLPKVVLKVNGRELSRFAAENHMTVHEFHTSQALLGCTGDIEIQIDSEVYSPGGTDLRELGIIVDWVTILPDHGGIVLPPPLPLASVLATTTIAFLPLKGRRAPRKVVPPMMIGVTIVVALLFGFRRTQAAELSSQLLLLSALGYLTVIIGRGVLALRGVIVVVRRSTVAILFLAMVVHITLLAPGLDEGPNVWTYKNWIWHANVKGLQSLYLEPWALSQPVYPPLSLYMLNSLGWVYRSLVGPIPPPLEEPPPVLSFLIRLPGVICSILLALAIFLWVQPRQGHRKAHLAMVAFAFNPAPLLLTTRWGQMDSIHSLFLLLALLCAATEKPALSWVLISLGAAVKPQALLFVPILAVLTWRRSAWRGVGAGTLAVASTTAVLVYPFVQTGTWHKVIEYYAALPAQASYWTHTIHDALSVWWLVSLGKPLPKTDALWNLSLPLVGPLTYEVIGLSAVTMAYLAALWRLVRMGDNRWLWATAAYVAFANFMLVTATHANYLYSVFPLLAMSLLVGRAMPAIYLVLSVTWLANLVFHYPGIDWAGFHGPGSVISAAISSVSVLCAMLNTAVLGYWTMLLVSEETEEALPISPGTAGPSSHTRNHAIRSKKRGH